MKRITSLFFLLYCLNVSGQNYTLYIYYASCSDSTGAFDVGGGPRDSVIWSNGDTGDYITNVDTGLYTAYIYYGGQIVDSLTNRMFYDTWDITMADVQNMLGISLHLPYCSGSIYTHPICSPGDQFGVGDFQVIVWEDSVPYDTLIIPSCVNYTLYPYQNARPGHRYDICLNDTNCDCHVCTWQYSPSRSFYFGFTGISYIYLENDIELHSNSYITLHSGQISNDRAQIYSIDGKLIFESAVRGEDNIDISNLESGMYLLVLEKTGITRKFAKL
jgi:hypothetical protein